MQEGSQPGEERQEPRFRVNIRGTLLVHGRRIDLVSENVSQRGIFFRSNDPVGARHLVRLRLLLPPNDDVLVVPAMVVHSVAPALAYDTPAGFGVRFVGLDGEPRSMWARFLRHVMSDARVERNEPPRITEDTVPESSFGSELAPYRPILDFAVCVDTVTALEALVQHEIARGRLLVPTDSPAQVGTPVRVHVVHPLTFDEFVLDGRVLRYEQGDARGLALIELVRMNDDGELALMNFVHGIVIDEVTGDLTALIGDPPTDGASDGLDTFASAGVADACASSLAPGIVGGPHGFDGSQAVVATQGGVSRGEGHVVGHEAFALFGGEDAGGGGRHPNVVALGPRPGAPEVDAHRAPHGADAGPLESEGDRVAPSGQGVERGQSWSPEHGSQAHVGEPPWGGTAISGDAQVDADAWSAAPPSIEGDALGEVDQLAQTREATFADPEVLAAMREAPESKTKMLPADELLLLVEASFA